MRLDRHMLLLPLAAIGLLLSGCNNGTPQKSTKPVSVRLDWTPWAPHAALYVAQEKGFFNDEGISVTLYVPPDPETTTKLVATGRDQFGISYMTDVILAREQNFPVVSLASLVQHPLNCIMTLKKSGLDSPAKLKGKTIGTTGVPSDDAFLEGVLSKNGVKKGEYKLLNIGFNLAQALKSGNVDAIVGAYWPWEGIKMEEEGHPVNVMKLQDYGVPDYYELVLITRQDLLTKDPTLVRGFLKALVKGQAFVRDNPEAAVEILQKSSPELTKEFLQKSLKTMLPLMKSPTKEFAQDQNKWDEMLKFMHASGLIKEPMKTQDLFTNDFLP